MMGSTIISWSDDGTSASSARTARVPSSEIASASAAMERPQHILPKSDVLPIFMSYSTDAMVDVTGTRCPITCRYRSADHRSPRSNDETLRLTNDFESKFLFFAAAHRTRPRVSLVLPLRSQSKKRGTVLY